MIADLKPYSVYKDVSVPWLGEVPMHWGIRRLRALAGISTGARDTIERCNEGLYPFFIRSQHVERINTWSFDGEAVLTAGDGHVGKIFHYFNGKFDYHQRVYMLSNFQKIQGKFFFHYFRSTFHHEVFQGTAKSTVESLRLPMLQNFPIVLPLIAEQTAIVRFLDYTDCRIQRYIHAKKKLIALLEEQKQAIIQEAVTGRIDVRTDQSYAAYKDSGVEWLGEVPEHWEVRRLRNVAEIRFSNVDKHSKENEKAVRLCNYSDVYHNDRIHSGMNFMRATASDDEVNRFRLVTGDVLITKDSETWDDIGVPACVESTDPDIVCGYHLALLRPLTEMVNGEFLHATLPCQSVATQLHVRANGVTRFGLSQVAIKSIWLQIPPPSEQTAIVRYLDEKTSKIDKAITRTQREVELLREYHQRLTSDVVTGKLDVCEAAAKLPPEADDCGSTDPSDKIPDHKMLHDGIEPDTGGAML